MARKLKCETNTAAMDSRIQRAFEAWCGSTDGQIQTDFEHGQWWVTVLATGAQYSVVDATGCGSVDGFRFENVTKGDDES